MTSDPVERLWALSERHAPARVLVLVGRAVTARWLSSLLVERGATVGVRIHDVETLLTAAVTELAGEPLPVGEVLAEVHAALVEDPTQRFAAIAEHGSYQREVLRTFVELERGLAGSTTLLEQLTTELADRDVALLEAFARFRVRMQAHRAWWRGQAPQLVIEGHRRVSFLRRRAAAVALGFVPAVTSQWELRLLEVLGFERWDVEVSERPRRPLDLRLSCAGPEAEIAAVARLLRAQSERPAAVLAPSDAVPRWVARLRHRDVPVRAWVEQRAASTAAARVARAMLRVLAEPTAVRRDDLELLLFGPALRAWSATAEQLQIDYPRSPHPGDLRRAWEGQRASSFALSGLAKRLLAAGEVSVEALGERAQRYGWTVELLEQRRARVHGAHRLLAGAIERLFEVAQANDPAQLRALFDDWDLLGRAAVHSVAGPELTAARVIVDVCARSSERSGEGEGEREGEASFAGLSIDLAHALAGASTGSWEQSRALGGGGGPAVWVLPYSSVAALGRLPERLFLTGLDAHPQPPVHHDLISDALRSRLGLTTDSERFRVELRLLDELVEAAGHTVVGSWRHRDGAGAQRPPGPWIAGRQDEGRERAIGVDAIALPSGDEPSSAPLERVLLDWSREPELRRRVEAIRSHEASEVGPHTGVLGVRVRASVPYSASALQRYAAMPYRYFVERVIGLRERERSDTATSLLASEQGQAVHRALEAAHLSRLAAGAGPVELGPLSEGLLSSTLELLSEGYRKRAEHGQAEAIWANECERWAVELREWWQQWDQRIREGYGHGDAAGRSGSRGRPEPEVTIPGWWLLAVEWSPAGAGSEGGSEGESEGEGEAFELHLPLRTIPFVAAVDRIELDPIRSRIDIVDYKTSRPRWPAELAAQLRAGVHLQLPLYALAVQQVVMAHPKRLRLTGPAVVGSLRLEYLQRPPTRAGKLCRPEVRGFSPTQPLGLDASGQVWTIIDAAASFTTAFVEAIEAGQFPVVAREPGRRWQSGAGDRIEELARVIPSADRRRTGLPPALQPLPDARAAREVVQ